MEKNRYNFRQTNIGLCILRMLMCFEVVLCHFWYDDHYFKILIPFSMLRDYAVPVFMLMSFLLTQKIFVSNDNVRIKKRFWRIVWPQVGWGVLYGIVYMFVDVCFDVHIVRGISDMFWQIFTGHSPQLNATMWYQVVLIVISAIYFGVFYFCSRQKGMLIIFILMVFALLMQYSGLNYALFSGMRYELKYPLGRICEMIPYAFIGFSFAYYGIFDQLKKHRIIIVASSILIGLLLAIIPYMSFFSSVHGFGYSGIQKICVAILLVVVAVLFPFDSMPVKVKNIILVISRYTLGIYCMHRMTGTFMRLFLERLGIESGTFLLCVLNYIVCYFISAFIAAFPGKLCRQLVE